MVMRAPKGGVTITSKILNTLNTSIPIKDKKNLIPTFVDATFEKGQQIFKGASQMLKVKAIHNERIRTLFIRLEGSLDLSAAKQLIKRLQFPLKKEKRKIIIDFTGIQYLSPKAANLLVTKNLKRLFKRRRQIEMRNFSQIASGAFTNITNLISEGKATEEEVHPPQEIEPHTFHDHL
jgi:anti-anti-sigma regulatory factor